MPIMESINGVPVSYIHTLPKRRINAFGTIFCGKYDPESGLIFLLDDEEQLTDVVMQVPAKPAQPEPVNVPEPEESKPDVKRSKQKRNKKAPKQEKQKSHSKVSFSPVPFLAGAGFITLVTAIYVALQYALYEGLL